MSSTKNMHGGSAIECLPSEMLDAIFDCLLADDLYNQSRDGSEGHVDNDRHDNSQASGPFRYSPSIHALAQTSRTLHTKTLPWLYRTATIRSCIQQRRLLSRITQNPNIAPNVQHLILHEHEDMSSVLTRLDPIESTPGEAGRATAASTATAVRNMVITTTQGDVQENFGEEMRATTEACVDLVTLLLSCRHLKTFRYLGRRISSDGDSYLPYKSYTKFQMIFALTWSRMIANSCGSKQQPPSTEQEEYRPFACLKQVYITELGPWSWSQFLRDLLSLPELDTLSYIFPIDAWAFSLDPSPTRSATLQDLHLSTTAVDQRNFRALFGAVQNLTSLHLDISGISFKERNFDTYINILREHGSLLAKLCITARSGALKKLPPVSFSLFTRVKILSVPDSLLYDNETTIDGFISRLPRKVEELTVTVQASRERTSALLVDPALNRDQLPALKKVTVLVPDHENGSANHELGVWLRPISRIFPSRSLGFHYGKVSTTQPLHSG